MASESNISRESSPASISSTNSESGIENVQSLTDEDLKQLILKEMNLKEHIEQLQRKISKLTANDLSTNQDSSDADDDLLNGDETMDDDSSSGSDSEVSGNEDIASVKSSPHAADKSESESESESDEGSSEDGNDEEDEFEAPKWCVPIKANVMTFDWEKLASETQFDVIVADPPWQLATHAPTRGVAIAYQQLPDVCIEDLPIEKLQTNGFIFIWVINNKYAKAFELMEKWGYTYVDDITWVKQTVNRRMAKGHGYYLQHAKETCLVGKKGVDPPSCRHSVGSDIIFSERRGQSQKPEELYELIEELVPNGKYLEIFGRKNNLRDYWVTVGNEL
ncbi:MT-A70-domain-containing protein [Hesseltinella vesiculosa]|uniref:mRNA m(6)A methyltransferase n=1 Tax=Hesseltinella vesiculosa TaxID=101127 RepID=A0A1X2G460_9FUNG|nr:MT-A70-domain-containing protein [Hesseltinella vesiculosa]